MSNTFDVVKNIVVNHLDCDPEKVVGAARLDDLGADSLDYVEMIMALEEDFDLEIGDDKAENIQTVDDMVTLIDQLKAG